jgi:hypothetical protein
VPLTAAAAARDVAEQQQQRQQQLVRNTPSPQPQVAAAQPEPQRQQRRQPEPELERVIQHGVDSPLQATPSQPMYPAPTDAAEPYSVDADTHLVEVPCDVSFTQLLDKADAEQFRRALLHQAAQFCGTTGCLTCEAWNREGAARERVLAYDDRATWSYTNLKGLEIKELAQLRMEGCVRIGIESRLRFPISLLPLKPYTVNLNWGPEMWLFPEDKFELTQSSHKPVKLFLRREAFETGTSFCTKAELKVLRRTLFQEYEKEQSDPPFVTL